MSRILVIGGYGGFGARLCRRLAAAGHHLLVAGRDLGKATRLATDLPSAEPLALDRNGDITEMLERHRPELVIDAAGPFQGSRLGIPHACIAKHIPYLDLADARDFVTRMAGLDEAARAAGVTLVSGASSVPALSGAVARKLAEGLDRVDQVETSITVANRAGAGESVARAILSYVGRPVQLWRGRRWDQAYGWHELRREGFRFGDGDGLRGRLMAIADVPDCALLPELLPGRPSVVFRAGTELSWQMRALWLAGWPVRWGWAKSLEGAARWLLPFYRLSARMGGDRSAMKVVINGRHAGRPVERRWTLVASGGVGPEVPTLAAALLAEDLIQRRLPPGVPNPAALLPLERFEPLFDALGIRHERSERALQDPLYARIVGAAEFGTLPAAVRDMHEVCGDAGAAGEGSVRRGDSFGARLVAAVMRFPPSGDYPLHVAFAEREGIEVWRRDFGGHRFLSELSAADGRVVERFGPMRFAFDLPAGPNGIEMHLRRWTAFGVPLPLALAPRIAAREWEEGRRFRFDVRVAMPLVGPVVHYSGWLVRA